MNPAWGGSRHVSADGGVAATLSDFRWRVRLHFEMCNPSRLSVPKVRASHQVETAHDAPRAKRPSKRRSTPPTTADLLGVLDIVSACYRESEAKCEAERRMGVAAFRRILRLLVRDGLVSRHWVPAGRNPVGWSWPSGWRNELTADGRLAAKQLMETLSAESGSQEVVFATAPQLSGVYPALKLLNPAHSRLIEGLRPVDRVGEIEPAILDYLAGKVEHPEVQAVIAAHRERASKPSPSSPLGSK